MVYEKTKIIMSEGHPYRIKAVHKGKPLLYTYWNYFKLTQVKKGHNPSWVYVKFSWKDAKPGKPIVKMCTGKDWLLRRFL